MLAHCPKREAAVLQSLREIVFSLLEDIEGCEILSVCYTVPGLGHTAEDSQGGRFMYCYMYLRNGLNDNHYAHPLDLIIYLDMAAKKVLHDKSFMHKEVRGCALTDLVCMVVIVSMRYMRIC